MTTVANLTIRPFEVRVLEEDLADLQRRVTATRWPGKELAADRSQGAQPAAAQALVTYWGTGYDWRACEARLNALPQFMTEIDGLDVHFIHVRSRHQGTLPLIITHSWPGSVIELLGVVGVGRLGSRSHCACLGGADDPPRLYPLRRAGR